MKILTREEEQAHYNETLKGGTIGGLAGLTLGALGVYGAGLRYPAFRQLTVPLRAFLVTSSTTFGAIISADHYSRAFERAQHPDDQYQDEAARARAMENARRTPWEKVVAFGREQRYKIVGGSWVASLVVALALTGRNPYLSTQQKLVQARVYAQGLTVAVMLAAAALEVGDQQKGAGRWETIKIVDPNDPDHKHLIEKKVHHERYQGEDTWKDMVEAEEQRMNIRKEEKEHEREKREHNKPHEQQRQQKKKKNGDSGDQKGDDSGEKKK